MDKGSKTFPLPLILAPVLLLVFLNAIYLIGKAADN